MDYQPSYGFLKDCLYRSESYKVTLADAYCRTALSCFSLRGLTKLGVMLEQVQSGRRRNQKVVSPGRLLIFRTDRLQKALRFRQRFFMQVKATEEIY